MEKFVHQHLQLWLLLLLHNEAAPCEGVRVMLRLNRTLGHQLFSILMNWFCRTLWELLAQTTLPWTKWGFPDIFQEIFTSSSRCCSSCYCIQQRYYVCVCVMVVLVFFLFLLSVAFLKLFKKENKLRSYITISWHKTFKGFTETLFMNQSTLKRNE